MDKIIEVMLKTCRGKCNVFLNSLLSNYNFLAGMYVLSNPSLAVKNYRNVLELIEKYKDMQFEIDEYEVEFRQFFLYSKAFNNLIL